MRQQNHGGVLGLQFLDGRNSRPQARIVGDFSALHRHVEIDANEHGIAAHVTAQIVECAEVRHVGYSQRWHTQYVLPVCSGGSLPAAAKPTTKSRQGMPNQAGTCSMAATLARHQISLPIATAVSAMRLEKPHSLSYQDITRTKVPPMTLVWSMWKTDECGSWLKSPDTFGSLV